MLELAIRIYRAAIAEVPNVRFNRRNELQRTIVSLYSTILELSDSVLFLMQTDRTAGTRALLRSIIEARVDLHALLKDDTYLQNMMARYHLDWCQILEEAERGNAFLAGFNAETAAAALATHRASLNVLNENGIRALHVNDRFELAGMTSEYRSVYRLLCAEAHNSISALIDRHLQIEGDDFVMVMFGERDNALPLDSVAGIVLETSLAVHQFFGSGREAEFAPLVTELAGLREQPDAIAAPDKPAGD